MDFPSFDDQQVKRYIGDRIKAFRLARGLSQEELAKALGYDSQMGVAYLEDGDRGLKAEVLLKIAAILEVKVEDFYPRSVTLSESTIKLRAGKMDKDMEKSILSFAQAARQKFGKK